MRKSASQRIPDGPIAICYVVLLLGSAPFVPSVWAFLERHVPWSPFFPYLFCSLLFILCFRGLPKRPFRILGFFLILGIFLWSMSCLKRPVERIHFIEYGALTFFLFRFFRHLVKERWSYGLSFAGGFLVGVADELLQGFLPNRVFDPRDIWVNAWAGGLGVISLTLFFAPSSLPMKKNKP